MFKKMRLKSYLLMVFSTIIVLAAMITTLSIVGLFQIRNNTQVFIDNPLSAELAVKTCRIEANVAARDLREMVLTDQTDDYSTFTNRIYAGQNTIKEQIVLFKKAHGEEDGLAKKYEDSFNAWFGIAERAIVSLEQGDKEQAKEIILNECSPALNQMVAIVKEIDGEIAKDKLNTEKFNELTIWFFIIAVLSFFGISLIASLCFAAKTTKSIVSSTNELKHSVTELSKGNLETYVDYEANNEFGELATLMNFSFKELAKYISAIDFGMTEFAQGNFTTSCPVEFLGDFHHIQLSIEHFQRIMNHTLVELDMAAIQVNNGAEQVSGGAQALAQGTAEQAGSVEMLSANIAEISAQIAQSTEFSTNANSLGQRAGEVVQRSQAEMKQMLKAIKDIAAASVNIQKIIKTIEDIAFQTNILALNAAVEAARAGSAGKGFAVVADEVRSLAQKSAEAAKSTTELIENSLRQVSNGEKLAVSTDIAFDEVARNAQEILGMVENIAHTSQEQSTYINRISQGVQQISAVVQTNSATSEESAAASEELSGQAGVMKSLISQFQLIKESSGIVDLDPSVRRIPEEIAALR